MNNKAIRQIQINYDKLSAFPPQTIGQVLLSHLFVCREILRPIEFVVPANTSIILNTYYSQYRQWLAGAFCKYRLSFIHKQTAIKSLSEELLKYSNIRNNKTLNDIFFNTFIYHYNKFYNISEKAQNYNLYREDDCIQSIYYESFLPSLYCNQTYAVNINFNKTEKDIILQIRQFAKKHKIKLHKNKPFTEKDIKRFQNNKCCHLCYILIKNFNHKLSYPMIYKEMGMKYYLTEDKRKTDTTIRKNYMPLLNSLLNDIEIRKLYNFSLNKNA